MTITNQKPIYGFRYVDILHGDTLQAIAARELGNAGRWVELVAYNDLIAPFITGDEGLAGPHVLLYGAVIKVPAPLPVASTTNDPELVFERDVSLDASGGISVENGDFAVVSGRDNLRQALVNRVVTERGELPYHPTYGNGVHRLRGTVNGPSALLLAAEFCKSTVAADPRIARITRADATADGDAIRVEIEAQPIAGRVINLTADL